LVGPVLRARVTTAVLVAALGLGPPLAVAAEPGFRTNEITSAGFNIRGFTLTDHNGTTRTLADFSGKAVVVFFGFTHCPDVCPTGLAELAGAMRLLGKDSARVQVVFITLDPERDTQAVLAQYVPAFHPAFLGLRGSAAETARTAREFRVYFHKVPLGASGNYTVDHSTHSYAFGPDGRLRLYLRQGVAARDLAHDLRLLLERN
jgi:protein SCO1/2